MKPEKTSEVRATGGKIPVAKVTTICGLVFSIKKAGSLTPPPPLGIPMDWD